MLYRSWIRGLYRFCVVSLALLTLSATALAAIPLSDTVGRNETRVWSDRWVPKTGLTVKEQALQERLRRLGYQKVSNRPTQPHTWARVGNVVWIYRPAHRSGGLWRQPKLFGLELQAKTDEIKRGIRANGEPFELKASSSAWLQPQLLAESFDQNRALRFPVSLQALPAHVAQPLLALEDSRFYKHFGVDPKGLLRAVVANVKAGKTVQGGSTITQQLIKNRDLSPRQSLDRKASEAARAMALESRYGKDEILESYLNNVYFGHVKGIGVYGVGAAAQVFFSKDATQLTLSESALLAAVVQGPNGLSPIRNPQGALARRDVALDRMLALGWVDTQTIQAAKSAPLGLNVSTPKRPSAAHLRAHLKSTAKEYAPKRFQKNRGTWVESTVDPILQNRAEDAVSDTLKTLRKRYPKLAKTDLSASLVAIDAKTGWIRAYVGGDPRRSGDVMNRPALAKRQPGSVVKPFLLMEAYEGCGVESGLHPASRVSDSPITIGSGVSKWTPNNYDRKHHGAPLLHEALVHSYNIPFVRLSEHCGWDAMSARMNRSGLTLPANPTPAFVLGTVEVTPLQVAEAYTAFSGNLGQRVRPVAMSRLEDSNGLGLGRPRVIRKSVSNRATAWMIRENMSDVVERGTARGARVKGQTVFGKTGTSSRAKDAWFVGEMDGLVVVVWVGLDKGGRLGLTGAQAAVPMFQRFASASHRLFPEPKTNPPATVHTIWVDPKTGWSAEPKTTGTLPIVFRGRRYPGKKRFWKDKTTPVLK